MTTEISRNSSAKKNSQEKDFNNFARIRNLFNIVIQ